MTTKTVAFFGASGGVGLSVLRQTLAAGHHGIALCRTPSKLTGVLRPESTPNLTVVEGNVHDVAAVSRCLVTPEGRLVDEIVFTVGARFVMCKMNLEDPHVCEKGIAAVLEAIAGIRRQQQKPDVAAASTARLTPRIIVCSTTGMSRFGRDLPVAMMPLYHVALKVPHADKRAMEDRLAASGHEFIIVRPSLMFDADGPDGSGKPVRIGVEDPESGVEAKAIGYTISREDAGKWIAQNLVLRPGTKYLNKIATITY